MTLSQLADSVCAKVGQTDEDSISQCKRYLSARLRQIWDSASWQETLCLVTMSSTANSPWLVLPASTERVLKLRRNERHTLPPMDGVNVFDYEPELFDQASGPVAFASFAPVVHGPSEAGVDTVIVTQTSSLNAAKDAGKKAFIEIERANGSRKFETSIGSGSGFPIATPGLFIVRFGKEVTAGEYQVGFADGAPLSEAVPAAEFQATRRPRLRLLGGSHRAEPMLALCKRSFPGFSQDFESPALANVENALLAYATADMLERQRQYAKAQLKLKEAETHVAIMHDLEERQTARETRIIPAM